MSITSFLIAAAALPLVAQPPAALQPQDLRWRAAVDIARPADYALVALRQPAYARTEARFQDLRVFGPDGAPVAWTGRPAWTAGAAPDRNLAGALLDRVRTPEGALRFVVPARPGNAFHHAVALDTDEETFQREVTVETGNDLKNWSVAARGAILRLRVEGQLLQSLRVSYPASSQRYLRVTVANWPESAGLTQVRVHAGQTPPEEWTTLGRLEQPRRETPVERASRWQVSFDYGRIERARLSVETPAELFARRVEVRTSDRGGVWSGAGGGLLYRAGESRHLELELVNLHPRQMRIETEDRDNPPLELTAISLEAPVRWIVFPARAAGRYQLYLGRENAVMPDYDLDAVLSRAGAVTFVPHAAGEWEANPDFAPPPAPRAPFTERFPGLLPGALAGAVLGMGAAAWRLLRKAA